MWFLASAVEGATEGLGYMHGIEVIHCDHNVDRMLIYRSNDPTGLIGKVTDATHHMMR